MNQAMDSAGSEVGHSVGNRVGQALAGQIQTGLVGPEVTRAYAMALYSVVFYHGGFAWEGKGYQPGDYTVWEGRHVSQGDRFEKAFLAREADGSEWWRVRADKRSGDHTDQFVAEALFSKPDASGAQKILRMRAQMPGEQKASEVPITAETQASWVIRPTGHLTAESLAGATVGQENVQVPAGTYQARHVRYSAGTGQADWWLSNDVPGGLVQYGVSSERHGDDDGLIQLVEVGHNAKPIL